MARRGSDAAPETVEDRRSAAEMRHRKFRWTQFIKKLLTAGAGGTAIVFSASTNPMFSGEVDYKPGKDRWAIKTSVEGDDSVAPQFIHIKEFERLPPLPDLGSDKPFQTTRIPNEILPGLNEGDIVTTTGYIHYAHLDSRDTDFHIQMNEHATNEGGDLDGCLIVEIPHPESAGDDETLKKLLQDARGFIREHCFKNRKNGGAVNPPVKMTVTGQLFYDLHHSHEIKAKGPGGGRGKAVNGKPMPATTVWEIHPVFGVSLAP